MQTLATALLGATLVAWVLGPAASGPEAEIAACQQRCASIEDETDHATCRLNCREATEEKDRGHIIRWTEERSVGGPAPGQDAPPPPTRTVTTVTPRGEITETTGPVTPPPATGAPKAATQPPPTARQRYYFGLVGCQDQCDPLSDGTQRARCKLQCLRRAPGPPPPRTAPATAVASPTPKASAAVPARPSTPAPTTRTPSTAASPSPAPSTPAVDCTAQCASETNEDDRQTCVAQCRYAQERKARPTTQRETTSVTTRPAECRRLCSERATRCRDGCSGEGSDASTCRLQCDQSAASCERRCG